MARAVLLYLWLCGREPLGPWDNTYGIRAHTACRGTWLAHWLRFAQSCANVRFRSCDHSDYKSCDVVDHNELGIARRTVRDRSPGCDNGTAAHCAGSA